MMTGKTPISFLISLNGLKWVKIICILCASHIRLVSCNLALSFSPIEKNGVNNSASVSCSAASNTVN